MAWTSPRAGDLRDRIRVERRGVESDDMGGTKEAWNTILENVPAKVVATRGGETVQSMRLSGVTPYDVTIRLTADTLDIDEGDRIVTRDGLHLNIHWIGMLEEGRKSWLSLACKAGETIHG